MNTSKRTTVVGKLLCDLARGAPVGAGTDIDEAHHLDISRWEEGALEDMGLTHKKKRLV